MVWNSPPHVHMCEFSYNTQPTHAHWPASVERDGHGKIKPRQLPEEAMDVGKVDSYLTKPLSFLRAA